MKLRIPDYYKDFSCIASDCQHSCCVSWEIGIDEDTYQYYRSIEGEFGERLRKSIRSGDNPSFRMHHGKCPFLGSDHLCEIYTELGEESLCEVCTEYPRFEVEYAKTREKVLALSCEEASHLLFTRKRPVRFESIELPGELDDAKQTDVLLTCFAQIVQARDFSISLLQDRSLPIEQRIIKFLIFCDHIQEFLDANQISEWKQKIQLQDLSEKAYREKEISLEEWHQLFTKRMDILLAMEVMEEEWLEEINNVTRAFYSESQRKQYQKTSMDLNHYLIDREYEYEHLIVYFVYRYMIKSVYDGQFLNRAKFCVFCYLTIQDMDRMRFLTNQEEYSIQDRIATSRIFSKQVEHSEKCMEYLEDAIKNKEMFSLNSLYHGLQIPT